AAGAGGGGGRGWLALAAARDDAGGGRGDPRRLVGVVVGGDGGQRAAEALDERAHGRVRRVAAVEHDPRERGEVLRGVGGGERDEDLGAVARRDGELALLEPLEDVLDVHAADEDRLGLTGEEGVVAGDHGALERRDEVGDRRGREHRDLREHPDGYAVRGDGRPDLLDPLRLAAVDRDGGD